MLASEPERDVVAPSAVVDFAAGRRHRAVWRNEVGGLTFEVGDGADRTFIKWMPRIHASSIDAEAARMHWARHYTPVPEVVSTASDDEGAWLVTRPLPGDNAVSPRWKRDPATAVRAIGEGLRALHNALPVARCPFSWSADERVADARRRAGLDEIDSSRWHAMHQSLSLDEALASLADSPPPDQPVVCHGDACAPNTLIGSDGRWSAHVDLGALGVGDRWADLAVATWSVEWNYGPEWESLLLASYGIDPDPERTRYYRLLWDLGP